MAAQIRDLLLNAVHHAAGVGILLEHAVDPQLDAQVVRVRHIGRGREPRSHGRGVLETLLPDPIVDERRALALQQVTRKLQSFRLVPNGEQAQNGGHLLLHIGLFRRDGVERHDNQLDWIIPRDAEERGNRRGGLPYDLRPELVRVGHHDGGRESRRFLRGQHGGAGADERLDERVADRLEHDEVVLRSAYEPLTASRDAEMIHAATLRLSARPDP